ncbi:hypothetical protein [Streptomyces sp. NPDC057496]|uniref:hypothetical protein n=1 Tax=Streptomyces sp. NPDC057496 TaxID=3346149 RepID=UPI0036A73C36
MTATQDHQCSRAERKAVIPLISDRRTGEERNLAIGVWGSFATATAAGPGSRRWNRRLPVMAVAVRVTEPERVGMVSGTTSALASRGAGVGTAALGAIFTLHTGYGANGIRDRRY